MALPAWKFTLPVFDVKEALARLPAEARARLSWAQKPIEQSLAELQTQPLTDELLEHAAEVMWPAIGALAGSFGELVNENRDASYARAVDDLNTEKERLSAFVADADARDTIEWINGFLGSFLVFCVSLPQNFLDNFDPQVVEQLEDDQDFQAYVRGIVALMAALAVARENGDPSRARDLVNVSFLELNEFAAACRRQGILILPFLNEGAEERKQRFVETANRLRRALSSEDWAALRDSRMRDLR